jgi:PAS domain S-box-containing protein
VSQAIVWSPTRENLFDRICEAMVVFGKFDMAWIGLNDPHTGKVSVAAQQGDSRDYLSRIVVETSGANSGRGPAVRAILQGRAQILNDFLEDPGSHWHDLATECGFRSAAAFPIWLEGTVIGALAVYSAEQDFFGTQEVELLTQTALDISFAMDHLAGEEKRQQAEAALLESERLLMEAQEAGGIGTYTWYMREDRWVSSPFLDRIFGIDRDYARDLKGWTQLIAPDFRDEMTAYVTGIIQRHERFDLDYPILQPGDGEIRWVHGQGDIQRDAEDRPVALVGVIQDITERKAAEQKLRKISAAVEQSPLAIMITDPKGVTEYVNPAFTRTSGFSAEEAVGKNPRFLKSPLTPEEDFRKLWKTLARGEIWVGEFENLRKNGEVYFERATIAPVRDDDGHLVGYIALKDDITESKRLEVERRSLEAQLHQSQKLESLGSLAGGVAHDMNNVLGAIMGLASTLRESAGPLAPSAKSLDTIVNACMRGRGVVKSLLYFAKKDLQEEQSIDLNELVREMSQLLSHTTLKRIELRMDLREGIGLLRGDPGALSHALMNLCVNAMDAMPGGGTLGLRTDADAQGRLSLSVRDSGMGMPPDVLAKAMEPFFTTKSQDKGTGLGLSMVYGTMMAHEGTFDLVSSPGTGTEAILRFPASRVLPQVPAVEMTPVRSFLQGDPLGVLLVDDDELIREAVTPLLEMLGHTVTTAAGGELALAELQAGLDVDLVILDMNMPGLSGAETLPRLLELRPGLPVIMSSGYSDHEIAPLLVDRPTVTSIRKPFSLKELQAKIAQLDIHPARGG